MVAHSKADESPPTTPTPKATRRLLRRPNGVRQKCSLKPMVHSPNTPYTPPEHPTTRFSPSGSEQSPALIPLLLLLSCDIQTNLNFSYPCSTCSRPYNKGGGSLQCPILQQLDTLQYMLLSVPQKHHIPPGWV